MTLDPATNNLVAAKLPVFTIPGFWITSAIFFGIWWLLTSQLSRWSLKQDETGAAECTRKMRFYSGWGIVAFALTLTFSGVLWMQATCNTSGSPHLRRLFLCRLRVDRAGDGLCHRGDFAAPAAFSTPVLKQNYFYFIGVLLLRLHAAFGLRRIRAILCRLERQHAGGNLLVSHPRTRQLVVVEHDFDFRPFLHAVLCAAAGEGENQFQGPRSRLPLGLADARGGSGASTFFPRCIRHGLSAANGSGCRSAACCSWADFWRKFF